MSTAFNRLLVALALFHVSGYSEELSQQTMEVVAKISEISVKNSKVAEREAARLDLLRIPQWREHAWMYLNRLSQDAEITPEIYDEYKRRRNEIADQLKNTTDGREIVRLQNERDKCMQDLVARFDAAEKIARIVRGLGIIGDAESVDIIAPLLDAGGISVYEESRGAPAIPQIAQSGLSLLKEKGIQFRGISTPSGNPIDWHEWWKREKKHFNKFRLSKPASVAISGDEGSNIGVATSSDPTMVVPIESASRGSTQSGTVPSVRHSNLLVYILIVTFIGALVVVRFTMRRTRR